MSKSALITGITGQDGAYLARLLREEGYQVWGTSRQAEPSTENLAELGVDQEVNLIQLDLTDSAKTTNAIRKLKPCHLYNLAAPSSVNESFSNPAQSVRSIVVGTANLLDAIDKASPHTRFYQASSSEMFGDAEVGFQQEGTRLNPQSPYGVAKASAHLLTGVYRKRHRMFAASGILFNHESPLRPPTYVSRKITKSLVSYATGGSEVLRLGNLDVSRDFGYAGDYVRAMYLMLTHSVPDDFVVATGESKKIRDFANLALKELDINYKWVGSGNEEYCLDQDLGKAIIKVDPELYRPLDVKMTRGDARKVEKQLSWKPTVHFKEMVALMVAAEYRAQKSKSLLDAVGPS